LFLPEDHYKSIIVTINGKNVSIPKSAYDDLYEIGIWDTNNFAYYDKEDDIGKTYIEIDLTRQHMWFYKEGKLLLDTDIVTGDVSKKVETPVGVMKVWSREKDRNLKGLSPLGYDYVAHVDYWMPINWKGVGIHDANWQPSSAFSNTSLSNFP